MNRRYRKTIIAGHWKMNKTPAETKEFIAQLKPHAARAKWCETVLCVPYIDLPAAVKAAKNTRVFIAAQNMHHAESGAYTGEVSGPMLCSLGVKYVVIGHSERRQYFGETDEIVAQKVKAALSCGLRPIVCVGESMAQREKNLFQLVYLRHRNEGETLFEDPNEMQTIHKLEVNLELPRQKAAEMHRRMQYYSYSMAVMMATGYLNFSEEEISTELTEYYRIMLSYYKQVKTEEELQHWLERSRNLLV